jgi:hypothetical protein
MKLTIQFFIFFLFCSVKAKGIDVSCMVRSYPLQDTLIAGVQNDMEVIIDGKPAFPNDFRVGVSEGILRVNPYWEYVLVCTAGNPIHNLELWVIRKSDNTELLRRKFVVISTTSELNTRIQPLLEKHKIEKHDPTGIIEVEHLPIYNAELGPIHDTLIPDFDNYLKIYADGNPVGNLPPNLKFTVKGENAYVIKEKGKFFVRCKAYTDPRKIILTMTIDDQIVFSNSYLVPVMTNELKKRVELINK